jgi:hypothetical protein
MPKPIIRTVQAPAQATCARCADPITAESTYWVDRSGSFCCSDYHGHDEHGVFAPIHDPSPAVVIGEDEQYYVLRDGYDACRFDEDTDDWVVPFNPYTS